MSLVAPDPSPSRRRWVPTLPSFSRRKIESTSGNRGRFRIMISGALSITVEVGGTIREQVVIAGQAIVQSRQVVTSSVSNMRARFRVGDASPLIKKFGWKRRHRFDYDALNRKETFAKQQRNWHSQLTGSTFRIEP